MTEKFYSFIIFSRINLGTFLCSIIIEQFRMKKVPKSSDFFVCENCDYTTCRQSQYNRHILTSKHINRTKLNILVPKSSKQFICNTCNKIYKARSSLWYHEQKCLKKEDTEIVHNDKNNDLIEYLIKENAEMKQLVIDVCKNMQPTTNVINNTNNTNNNKTFNLNLFLNEECKDAMNIMDFVDSVKIQLSDLENVGKLGFVDGISNIIVKNLKALDVNKRPVHCSDKKREIMYIKDQDKWEKENDEKNKLRKAIKHIAHKNTKMFPQFKAKYPDCIHSESNKSDQYNKIIIESMGGHGDNDKEKENKIMKKIAKEVIIEK